MSWESSSLGGWEHPHLLSLLCSKLTRESGTDFPIPVIPPVPDSETEKLIREKDEEVSTELPFLPPAVPMCCPQPQHGTPFLQCPTQGGEEFEENCSFCPRTQFLVVQTWQA